MGQNRIQSSSSARAAKALLLSVPFLCLMLVGRTASCQPGPFYSLRNSNLVLTASLLTSNGVPGLSAPPAQLMVYSVPTNSAQGGKVSLNVASWGRSHNGPGNYWDLPNGIVVDATGNVIVTGNAYGNGGTSDDFTTIKYTSSGTALWTNRYHGGYGADKARFVGVDGASNIYITGDAANGTGTDVTTIRYAPDGTSQWTNHFALPGALYWQPGSMAVGATGAVYVTAFAFDDALPAYIVVKYDAGGGAVWTNFYKGSPTGYDSVGPLGVDAAGNVFVTGGSDNGSGNIGFTTFKYAPNGTCLWTNRYSRSSSDAASSLVVDKAGNVIVTGDSSGGAPNHAYVSVKYTNNGTPVWTNLVAGPAYLGGGVPEAVADPAGNVLVTGGSPTANGSYADFTTVKYSSGGTPLWTNRFTAPSTYGEFIGGIGVDSAGQFFLSGNCSRSFGLDFFTIKYSPNGVPIWTNYFNGYSGSGVTDDNPKCLAVGANGSVYVAGFVTIGTSSAVNWETLGYTNYVRYTPPTNYIGTDTFSFVAFDTQGNSVTSSVTVAVLPASLQFNTALNLFRRTAQGVQLQVDGARTTNSVVILASSNLVTWDPIFSNPPVLGTIQFTDAAATNTTRRFYRAMQ